MWIGRGEDNLLVKYREPSLHAASISKTKQPSCFFDLGFEIRLIHLNIKEWRISLWWLILGRNTTFHAVLCSYTWTVHITLCAVELQWHKMYRKCPQHPSNSLLTTAAEEKQTSHMLLFLCLFGLFTPWYECICDRFDCRICCDSRTGNFQVEFWWFSLRNCVRYKHILINMWLPCMVNM